LIKTYQKDIFLRRKEKSSNYLFCLVFITIILGEQHDGYNYSTVRGYEPDSHVVYVVYVVKNGRQKSIFNI